MKIIAVVLLLVACAEKKGLTPAQAEHKAYVAKVNAVCTKYNKEAEKLPEPPRDLHKLSAWTHTFVSFVEHFAHDMKAVPPPAKERAEVAVRLWAPLGNVVTQVRGVASNFDRALQGHADEATLRRLENSVREIQIVDLGDAWLNDFGLIECTDD
jgi:hypothetical protein